MLAGNKEDKATLIAAWGTDGSQGEQAAGLKELLALGILGSGCTPSTSL